MLINFARKIALWILVAGLAGLPLIAPAAVQQIVAQVVRSSGASLHGTAIPTGTTIVTGDVLSTAKGGSALVKFSAGTQASLLEETSVRFLRDAGHAWAKVSSGTVAVTSFSRDVLVVETPKYKVAPAEERKAVYLVALLPDHSTVVAARQGKVSVTEISSGLTYNLAEDHYALITASSNVVPAQEKEENKQAPGNPAGQAPVEPSVQASEKKPKESWHIGSLSHGGSIGVVAGAVGGGAIAAILASSGGGGPVSPSQP